MAGLSQDHLRDTLDAYCQTFWRFARTEGRGFEEALSSCEHTAQARFVPAHVDVHFAKFIQTLATLAIAIGKPKEGLCVVVAVVVDLVVVGPCFRNSSSTN
eukprot:66185-Amphidinium_carterae.1